MQVPHAGKHYRGQGLTWGGGGGCSGLCPMFRSLWGPGAAASCSAGTQMEGKRAGAETVQNRIAESQMLSIGLEECTGETGCGVGWCTGPQEMGGIQGAQTYITQNACNNTLIILRYVSWGNVFLIFFILSQDWSSDCHFRRALSPPPPPPANLFPTSPVSWTATWTAT